MRGSANPFPQNKPAWLFLAPFTLFYVIFLIGPTIYMFVMSFFNTSLVRPGLSDFAGISNYSDTGNAVLEGDIPEPAITSFWRP